MGKIQDYQDKIKSILSEVDEIEKSGVTLDASKMLSDFNGVLDEFKGIIPGFFTGEEDDIKVMYDNINEASFSRNGVIPFIDVNMALHIYMDYYNGMCDFIRSYVDSFKANDNDSISRLNDDLDLAIDTDSSFIDSIYGGSKNKKTLAQISDAVGNVESLIDMLNTINTFSTCTNSIKDSFDNFNCEEYTKLANLLIRSTTRFLSRGYNEIIDTYKNILVFLGIINEDPTPEVESFALF